MPIHNCEFRYACPSDAPTILVMQRQLAEYCHYDMSCFRNTATKIAAALRDQSRTVAVLATYDRRPAGYMLCLKLPAGGPWSGVGGIYIEDLFVTEDLRAGHGIGTQLVALASQFAREIAEDDGFSSGAFVRLDTSKLDNEASQGFYRHHGFTTSEDNFRISGIKLERLRRRASALL